MIRLGTALAGLGGALGGGFLGATAHYAVRTLGQRRRDEQSGLQAQRQAVQRQFGHVRAARDWVAGLAAPTGAGDTPEDRHRIREEAARRYDDCRGVWNSARPDIDSDEVRTAMARLDRAAAAVLDQVAQGDFAPDLNRLQQRLDELVDAARHRLTIRLHARSGELTRFRGGGEAHGRTSPGGPEG
ncbi:hypothetical protein [Streptomyces capoamus]|uniref:hypothetical protein n=1 Tax=Streptomyces capoamus TaxID=68183 RepID=UPI003396F280